MYEVGKSRVKRVFWLGAGFPDVVAYSLKGKPLFYIHKGHLVFLDGYQWNGCTGLPYFLHTQGLKESSLPHDALYQLLQNGLFGGVNWRARKRADLIFKKLCPNPFKHIFFAIVRLFGWVAAKKQLKTLTLRPL